MPVPRASQRVSYWFLSERYFGYIILNTLLCQSLKEKFRLNPLRIQPIYVFSKMFVRNHPTADALKPHFFKGKGENYSTRHAPIVG